jgi:hypothetical protein
MMKIHIVRVRVAQSKNRNLKTGSLYLKIRAFWEKAVLRWSKFALKSQLNENTQ